MTYYTYHFKCGISKSDAYGDANTVQVTGNFDNWSKASGELIKEADLFEGVVRFPKRQKLVFKFIINDNEWKVSDKYKIEHDSSGIENNYIDANELTEVQEFEKDDSFSEEKIPEKKEELSKSKDGITRPSTSSKEYIDDNEDKPNLTQVLTSSSSFAAVSIPGSNHSEFEHLTENKIDPHINTATEEEFDDQYNTPTNSLFNSTVLTTPAASFGNQNKDEGDSSIEYSKRNDSNATLSKRDEAVQILKAPGAYPSTTPSKSNEEIKGTVKKENLITKFKSLFKY